jgi:type III secretion protein J
MLSSQLNKFFSFLKLSFFVFLLFAATGCESRKVIVNGLDEKEANEIVVFLSARGIDAAKVKSEGGGGGGQKLVLFDISVEQDQANEAMSLLNQNGLPRRRGQNLLGLFSNVGLVPSEMQDKIRYQAGLAEQIASTIRKIDGVLDAEVQISFPEEDPLNPKGEKKTKITASVYVKHSGVLDDPNSHLVTKIKRLVAASVTGLDFDDVTVIGDRARFSETPGGMFSNLEEEKQYVSVWSIIIAQESLFRFRVIFFGFTLIILLLILSFVWVAWKVFPLLKEHGGIKELFHLHPIKPLGEAQPTKEQAAAESEKGEKEAKTSPPEEKGLVDEDIDESS